MLHYSSSAPAEILVAVNGTNLNTFLLDSSDGSKANSWLDISLPQGGSSLTISANSGGSDCLILGLEIHRTQLPSILLKTEAENFTGSTGNISTATVGASQAASLFVSDGSYVTLNSSGSSLEFDNVAVDEGGSYRLTIATWQTGATSLNVLVDDILFGAIDVEKYVFPYQARARCYDLTLTLTPGNHKITLVSDNQLTIDYLTLSRQQATTYYVSSSEGIDSNDGLTEATPIASLEAISSINLFPGDRVLFKSGDTFYGLYSVNGSGAEGNPILIGRYGQGSQPILDASSGTGADPMYTVHLNNISYIELDDLEINNDRQTSHPLYSDVQGYGILVYNNAHSVMSHFHFRNITVRNVYAISTEGIDFDALQVSGICFRCEKNDQGSPVKNIRDINVSDSFFTRTGKFAIWSQHKGGEGEEYENRNMDLVFRGNHTYQTGGSGICPSSSYNCLLENNIFEYTGSDADERMAKRGSGAWFYNCRNVLAQYNISKHARGNNDSYGMHIDWGNKNVIFQYNYSEDSEGGFCEILGDNINSCYRYNISVNDGIRSSKGNSIWVSDYSASYRKSDNNYIYNNTIYVDADITPDISIVSKNTYIYNNIFYAVGNGQIGQSVNVNISSGSELLLANNLFYGNISQQLRSLDSNSFQGNPLFAYPGQTESSGYLLLTGSPALDKGLVFPEPEFPMAGQGIFAHVPLLPTSDNFGNPAQASTTVTHLGAYNGQPLPNSLKLSVSTRRDGAVDAAWASQDSGILITGYELELLGGTYTPAASSSFADPGTAGHVISPPAFTTTGIRLRALLEDGSFYLVEMPLETTDGLLVNGGFETGTMEGWNSWNNELQTSSAPTGSYAGAIKSGSGSLRQLINLRPYYRYRLQCTAKLNSATDEAILQVKDHQGDLQESVPLDSTSFKTYTLEFSTDDDPSQVTLSLFKNSGGRLITDDFSLQELGPDSTIDEDNDGLPDGWEVEFLLSTAGTDGTFDSDSDGATDLDEYLMGTDPLSDSSRFQATIQPSFSTPHQLDFYSIPGRRYILETSETLENDWIEASTAGPFPSRGSRSFTLPINKNIKQMFMRVRVELEQ